jgi:hypothetical protein
VGGEGEGGVEGPEFQLYRDGRGRVDAKDENEIPHSAAQARPSDMSFFALLDMEQVDATSKSPFASPLSRATNLSRSMHGGGPPSVGGSLRSPQSGGRARRAKRGLIGMRRGGSSAETEGTTTAKSVTFHDVLLVASPRGDTPKRRGPSQLVLTPEDVSE